MKRSSKRKYVLDILTVFLGMLQHLVSLRWAMTRKQDPWEQTLMSGMLLYQSMIFGDKYEEDSLEYRPLLATSDQDVAIVLHCFEGGICSKLILPEKDIAQGVKIKANAVKWYHLASMTMLAKLFAQLGFPLNVLSLFGDTTLRNRYKTTVDGAIVMCITSLCLFDSLVSV